MIIGRKYSSIFNITINKILVNADILPLISVYRNSTLTTIVVNVSGLETGIYSYSFDIPSNWNYGDIIDLQLNTTVNSFKINKKIHLGKINIDSKLILDYARKAAIDPVYRHLKF